MTRFRLSRGILTVALFALAAGLPQPTLAAQPKLTASSALNSKNTASLRQNHKPPFEVFARMELDRAEDLIEMALTSPVAADMAKSASIEPELQAALHSRIEVEQALGRLEQAPVSDRVFARQEVRENLFALQESLDQLEGTVAAEEMDLESLNADSATVKRSPASVKKSQHAQKNSSR